MKLKYAATMLLAGSSSGTASTSASDQPCPCWTPSDLNAVTKDQAVAGVTCRYLPGIKEFVLFGGTLNTFEVHGGSSKECLGPSDKAGIGTSLSEEQYKSCVQEIKKRCAEIDLPLPSVASANQGEMETFEQQVSVAQGKNTMASNSSSALSLLLPGAVVTVATYLITIGI